LVLAVASRINSLLLSLVMCGVLSSFLYVIGDILEIGAQWAIAKKDVDMFERYMAQLKCYYLDYRFEFIIFACTGSEN